MQRITGIDVARALALLGMVVAHLVTPLDPDAPGGVDLAYQIVSGRSAALFAVLAGVSIALVTRRSVRQVHHTEVPADGAPSPPHDRRALVVRSAVVATMGIVLGTFPSGAAVILCYYGVLFLCALPVLRWRAGSLALLALGWGLLSPIVSMLTRGHLPEPTYQVPNLTSLADPLQLLTELTLTGYYPVLTWATYLFAGMAIGRVDLRDPVWGRRLLVWGAWGAILALGVARWLTGLPTARAALVTGYDRWEQVTSWADLETVLRVGLYGTTPTTTPWWLAVWSPHSGSIIDLAHTTGIAMLVIGLALVLVQLTGSRATVVWRVVFGAGTMTLTLYAAHVLVMSARQDVPLAGNLWLHLAGVLVIGALFALRHARGPLEQLVSRAAQAVRRPAVSDLPSK